MPLYAVTLTYYVDTMVDAADEDAAVEEAVHEVLHGGFDMDLEWPDDARAVEVLDAD